MRNNLKGIERVTSDVSWVTSDTSESAVPAYKGSLAEARRRLQLYQSDLENKYKKHKTQSQHFKHADTNVATPVMTILDFPTSAVLQKNSLD
eukprot:1053449-Pelagomonas_calceolata.AAC.1